MLVMTTGKFLRQYRFFGSTVKANFHLECINNNNNNVISALNSTTLPILDHSNSISG